MRVPQQFAASWMLAGAWMAFLLQPATAGVQLLVEAVSDTSAPNEVYLASFDTLADLVTANLASPAELTQIDLAPQSTIRGFTHGDGLYQLLIETESGPANAPSVRHVAYDSLADLVLDNPASGPTLTLVLPGPANSYAGFTKADSGYYLIDQTDTDAPPGSDVVVQSAASIGDLLAGSVLSFATAIEFSESYRSVGLAFDGAMYHVLLEAVADAPLGNEVFLLSFNSLSDLLDGTLAYPATATQLEIDFPYNIVGFTFDASPVTMVAEPGAFALLLVGLAAVHGARRSRRDQRLPRQVTTELTA